MTSDRIGRQKHWILLICMALAMPLGAEEDSSGSTAGTVAAAATSAPAGIDRPMVPLELPAEPPSTDAAVAFPLAIGTLPAGKSMAVQFQVTVPSAPVPAGLEQIESQGTVSGTDFADLDTDDPDAAGAADPTLTLIAAAPDLAVVKTVIDLLDGMGVSTGQTAFARSGETIVYQLAYQNKAAATQSAVASLTDDVPTATTFDAGNSDGGWTGCADDAAAGTTCTLSLGTLAPGDSGTATFAVTVDDPVAMGVIGISNTADITVPSDDPAPADNTSMVATPLVFETDIQVEKTVDESEPIVGDRVTFTVKVTNNGPSAATSLMIDDLLASGLDFVAPANPSQGTYDEILGVWDVGTVGFGAMATLEIMATVNPGLGDPAGTGAPVSTGDFVTAGSGGLDLPTSMAFGADGNLYVAGFANDAVLRYDGSTGAFLGVFVTAGSGGLDEPTALAFGPAGDLYIASSSNDEVLRYDGVTGALVGTFVTSGSGGLDSPSGITFGPDGDLYVSSSDTGQALRYDGTSGAFLGIFVAAGAGGLGDPADLTFGADGHLYVADIVGDTVLRFDGGTGAFIDAFVSANSGGLDTPGGLRFGPEGDLFVSSLDSDEVFRFEGITGTPVGGGAFVVANSAGLDGPRGIVFGSDGHLYVVSELTDEVLRYDGFLTNFAHVGSLDQEDIDQRNDWASAGVDPQNADYGDAPDPTYPTLRASDGARHIVAKTGSPLRLGGAIDTETDGQPDLTATGDDTDLDGDDEEGVVFGALLAGLGADVDVTASAASLLDAWVDFDGDGTFAAPGEQIFTDEALAAGVNSLAFSVPATLVTTTFARFRLSSAGGLGPDGTALDGEVEDYQVVISQPPTISISGPLAAVTEGDAGTTPAVFTITRSHNLNAPSVDFETLDVSAFAGTDYTAVGPTTVSFTAGGVLSMQVSVDVFGDEIVELDEAFTGLISNPMSALIGTASAGVMITNDDSATVSLSGVTLAEGSGGGTTTFAFTVSLDAAVDVPVGYDFATADGSAEDQTGDGDYTSTSGTSSLPGNAGDLQTFDVQVTADSRVELDEAFSFVLSSLDAMGRDVAFAGAGATETATGSILNDDSATISIDDVTMAEGDSPTTTLFDFTVSLDTAVDVGVDVTYTTTDGTAEDQLGDGDYQSAAGMVTFPAGAAGTQTISITVNGDDVGEPDENFFVNLLTIAGSGRDVTFADNQGEGTIVQDDEPTISIAGPGAVNEGNAGTTDAVFTISRNHNVGTPSVDFETVDGSATAGTDYTAVGPTTISFTDGGALTMDVTVDILTDLITELDETFDGQLSNVSTGAIGTATATATIVNDDPVAISIDDVTMAENASGATTDFVFTVSLSGPANGPVTVEYTTQDGSATTADGDYVANAGMLTFVSPSTDQTITVTVNDDAIGEPTETFTVELMNESGGTILDGSGLGTITDDDDNVPPTVDELSIEDCATITDPVGTIDATFSESVAGGDDPAHYLLIAAGPDNDLTTTSCAGAPAGDDVLVPIGGITEIDAGAGPPTTAPSLYRLAFTALDDGLHRLMVCDTLTDDAGNRLDGDDDAIAGGDFVRRFRVDQFNRIEEGHFDCDIDPVWVQAPAATFDHDDEDVDDASLSGSASVFNPATNISSIGQCSLAYSGLELFSFSVRLDAAADVEVGFSTSCVFYDGPACSGAVLGSDSRSLLMVETGGAWIDDGRPVTVPVGAASTLCVFAFDVVDGQATFTGYVDNVFFGRVGLIFNDGFESGDESAWSEVVP
ncbi:MAG: DUF11 domain-containing protein [Phycisphaerales bacterium]|nr:DUF11 domain-containing protein [Phycisphaerales bacterium]